MLQSQIEELRKKLSEKATCELDADICDTARQILAEFPNHPNIVNLRAKYAPGAGGGFTNHVETYDLLDLLNQIPAKPITSEDVDRNGTGSQDTDKAPPVTQEDPVVPEVNPEPVAPTAPETEPPAQG